MGQQGAGETMTSNYPSTRPLLHPDTQGAHPLRRDKDSALLRQTAVGPYGGVPCGQSGITVTVRIQLPYIQKRTYTQFTLVHEPQF